MRGWHQASSMAPVHYLPGEMSLGQFLLTSTPLFATQWLGFKMTSDDISTYESSSPNTLWLQTVLVKTSLLSNRPAAPLLLLLPVRLDLVKGILIASSTASHQIAALISFRLKWYEGKYVCNLKCFIEHQSSQNVYHMLLLGPSGHCLTPFFSSFCTNSTKQHYYTILIYDSSLYILYLFWSCILVHILYSRLSYKCFGASLSFGWLWLNGQFACGSFLFFAFAFSVFAARFSRFCSQCLESRRSCQIPAAGFEIFAHKRFGSRLLKCRWISLNVSAIKHY